MATIDDVAAYWDARPCNIRHSDKPVGTREYFDEVEARKYRVEPHIPGFAQFERWRDKDVLEVGCGIGTDTINFLRAGAHVAAIDVSSESVALTKRRAQVYGLGYLDVVEDDLLLQIADAEHLSAGIVGAYSYDLVYSFGVLHHTPEPWRALMEIRKVIKPDGELRLMMYHRWSTKTFRLTGGRMWRDDLVARQSEAQTGSPVTRTYSRRQLRRLLRDTGFEVTDERVEHIFPYRWQDYIEHRYVRTPLGSALPPWAWRALEHTLGWHLCVVARPI